MTAMVGWTDSRLRLARYRHGWGVVCGLRVECDPKHPSGVVVTPGYAIGCCGEDIVVCADAAVDLSSYCKPESNCDLKAQPAPKTEFMDIGCLRIPAEQVRIVDIFVTYDQHDTDPQTALGRGICHRDVECEFTRSQETYRIVPQTGLSSDDPFKATADQWKAGYDKCTAVLDAYLQRFAQYHPTNPKALEEVRSWLLQWIDRNPLHEFYFVRDCIRNATTAPEESEIVRWLFWIVQDCRNAYAACNCYSCETNRMVPLGRAWMRATETDCTVVRVDPYPPYRRNLAAECWPAPLGYVNLARLLWHPLPTACCEAAQLGVNINPTPVEFVFPPTVAGLRESLDCSPMVDCGAEPVLQFLAAGDLGRRVVGFCGHGPAPHPAATTVASGGSESPGSNDLTLLPNIGEARQTTLNKAGITGYQQIAAMSRDQLRVYLPAMADEPLDAIIQKAAVLARAGAS
jgi:hypothetical protein